MYFGGISFGVTTSSAIVAALIARKIFLGTMEIRRKRRQRGYIDFVSGTGRKFNYEKTFGKYVRDFRGEGVSRHFSVCLPAKGTS